MGLRKILWDFGVVCLSSPYYVFVNFHQIGQWQPLAHGTLTLVHIRTEDVRNIALLAV